MSDLFEKLKNSKTIMDMMDKKDGKKPIKEEYYDDDDDDDYGFEDNYPTSYNTSYNEPEPIVEDNLTLEEKVKNSKLPDVIKEIMIKKPIVYDNGLDIPQKILGNEKTKQLMGIKNSPKKLRTEQRAPQINNTQLLSQIETIIEKVVDRKFKEYEKSINKESLMESINENLLIKVGDTVFKGKITGYKK